ncbi:MAG: hypothetical protein LLG37_00030 [Spirochaetia bacterium]|nr:hypothetical protein [Spirochaetia bacterium]
MVKYDEKIIWCSVRRHGLVYSFFQLWNRYCPDNKVYKGVIVSYDNGSYKIKVNRKVNISDAEVFRIWWQATQAELDDAFKGEAAKSPKIKRDLGKWSVRGYHEHMFFVDQDMAETFGGGFNNFGVGIGNEFHNFGWDVILYMGAGQGMRLLSSLPILRNI